MWGPQGMARGQADVFGQFGSLLQHVPAPRCVGEHSEGFVVRYPVPLPFTSTTNFEV